MVGFYSSRAFKLFLFVILIVGFFGAAIWIIMKLRSNEKSSNHNAVDSTSVSRYNFSGDHIFELYEYFIPIIETPRTIFCTFFKTRLSDGQVCFTSLRSTTSKNAMDCYNSLIGSNKSEYSSILKSEYLQKEKNTIYTFESQINMKELDKDITFTSAGCFSFPIQRSEYSRFLKFLKSQEQDLQKKSFFTIFLTSYEISLFTFDDVNEFSNIFKSKNLQNIKCREKFKSPGDLLFFYILGNLVSTKNEVLEPVMTP